MSVNPRPRRLFFGIQLSHSFASLRGIMTHFQVGRKGVYTQHDRTSVTASVVREAASLLDAMERSAKWLMEARVNYECYMELANRAFA
jgi:hypothetical protein